MSHAYGKLKTPDKSTLFCRTKTFCRVIHTSETYTKELYTGMLLYILSTFTTSEVLWHAASSSCIMFVQYIRGGGGSVYYIGGCSVHWEDTMSTSGISCMHWRVFSTSRESHEYIGGYHEYIGGLSSTSAGYHDTCGKQGDKAF